jgi:hypothetical protein
VDVKLTKVRVDYESVGGAGHEPCDAELQFRATGDVPMSS